MLFGGSVFGVMAGLYYWFPKMTGRMLNEGLGKVQFVLMFIGFNLTFFPMHELGLAGMPRRIADYSSTAGWNDLNLAATVGGFMIAASMLPLLWNIFISLRSGTAGRRRPVGGQHPRVGDVLAAAALQLRPPARDPLRAPGLRRSATADDRGPRRARDDDDRQPRPDHDRRSSTTRSRATPTTRTAASATSSWGCSCSSPPR